MPLIIPWSFGSTFTLIQQYSNCGQEQRIVVADVCKALEIHHPTDALNRLNDDEKNTLL